MQHWLFAEDCLSNLLLKDVDEIALKNNVNGNAQEFAAKALQTAVDVILFVLQLTLFHFCCTERYRSACQSRDDFFEQMK